jgi:hypothetical protein
VKQSGTDNFKVFFGGKFFNLYFSASSLNFGSDLSQLTTALG